MSESKSLHETIERLLFILGVTLPVIMETDWRADARKRWIVKAIENVVYKNEPLPPMDDL